MTRKDLSPSDVPMDDIYALLNRLGATANYVGFFYLAYAIRLAVEDPGRLRLVTKCLYPDVAKYYGTKWTCVERNIRTIIAVMWDSNPTLLAEVVGFPVSVRPRCARMVAILTAYCTRNWKG